MKSNSELARQAAGNIQNNWPATLAIDDGLAVEIAAIIADTYAEAFPRWIPCSERMPEHYVTVLLCGIGSDGQDMFSGFIDEHGDWCHTLGRDYDGIVTHWQPLPQPPEATK